MKPDAPAKTIIDVSPLGFRLMLLLLILCAPVFWIFGPLLSVRTLPSATGYGSLAAYVFFFFFFLLLKNITFSFEAEGIRLPGIDRRLLPYASVRRIYTYPPVFPPILVIEYEPPKTVISRGTATVNRWITMCNYQYLTEDKARQLLELMSSKLSNCEISADAQDRLVNRQPETRLPEDWWLPKSMRPALERFVDRSDGFCRVWLACWTVIGFMLYAVVIFSMVTGSNIDSQIFAAIIAPLPDAIKEWLVWRVSIGRAETIGYEKQSCDFFFGSRLGQISILLLLCLYIGSLYFACAKIRRDFQRKSRT